MNVFSTLRRAWYWIYPAPEWRIMKHADGLWYVELAHPDIGWVHHEKGHPFMSGAAKEGRKSYERKTNA